MFHVVLGTEIQRFKSVRAKGNAYVDGHITTTEMRFLLQFNFGTSLAQREWNNCRDRDDTKNQSLQQQQKWQSLISGKVGTFAAEPALFLVITEIKGDSKNAKINKYANKCTSAQCRDQTPEGLL